MCALVSGDRLTPRFSLIRPLGRGGGRVWVVRDDDLDEEVVAKILPRDSSEEAVSLLLNECRQARRLIHPNIVRVFDFHRGEGRSFITMERVEGEDLTHLRGRSPAEIVDVMIPVADALAYAHGMGVVHRDLKATNVVRDNDGRPHLLEFGISGAVGERPADDLYAFGALLYDLITGDHIHSSIPETLRSPYPVPERLRSLVAALLAKHPGDRSERMTDVVEELTNIRGALEAAPTQQRPSKAEIRVTPPPRVTSVRPLAHREPTATQPPAPRRGRAFWITTAVIAALGIVAVSVFVFLPRWAEAIRGGPQVRPMSAGGGVVAVAPDAGGPDTIDPTSAPNPEHLSAMGRYRHVQELAAVKKNTITADSQPGS